MEVTEGKQSMLALHGSSSGHYERRSRAGCAVCWYVELSACSQDGTDNCTSHGLVLLMRKSRMNYSLKDLICRCFPNGIV